MTTVSDTPDLEKKTTKEDIGADIKNVTGFLSSTAKNIFGVFVYFALGGLVLYGCKLAQSNILPTDSNCFPYTDKKPNIESIFTDIFFFGNDTFKIKFQFNPDDIKHPNTKHFIPDTFRASKNDPNVGFLSNFFMAIIEGIMSFNYKSFNVMLNLLNHAPESFIVLAGPIIMFFFTMALFYVNLLVGVVNWFYNLSWIFKTNVNPNDDSSDKSGSIPVWESAKGLSWFARLILALIMAALFGFSAVFSIPVFLITMFSLQMYKGEYNNNQGKLVGCTSVIKDTIVYYKVFIASIISLYMVGNAFSYLGIVGGIVSLFAILIVYSDLFIKLKLFVTTLPEGLTPTNEIIDQADRVKCKKNKSPVESSSWTINPMSFFDSKVQSGGTRILSDNQLLNEIKKVSKRLNREIL